MGTGDSLEFTISQGVETVQWRSNHLRDDWSNVHSYDGETTVSLEAIDILHQLEHLPGVDIQGNHTISLRGIIDNGSMDSSSTPIITANILMNGVSKDVVEESDSMLSSTTVLVGFAGMILGIVLVPLVMFGLNKSEEGIEAERIKWDTSIPDEDIEAILLDETKPE